MKEVSYRLKKIGIIHGRESRVHVGTYELGDYISMLVWREHQMPNCSEVELKDLSGMKVGQQFRIWDGRLTGGITTSPVTEIFSDEHTFKDIEVDYFDTFHFSGDNADAWAKDTDCPIKRTITKKEYFKTNTSIYELLTFNWEDTRG